jgi:hypothetical protein
MTEKLAQELLLYGTISIAAMIFLFIIAFVVVYERKRNKKFYGYNATDNTWYERELEPEMEDN